MRQCWFIIVLTGCLLSNTFQGSGDDRSDEIVAASLSKASETLVPRIIELLNNEQESFVRPFSGPGTSNAGIATELIDRLKSKGIANRSGARFEIEGRLFRIPADTNRRLQGFRIQVAVVDQQFGGSKHIDVTIENRDEASENVEETGEVLPPPNSRHGDQPPRTEPVRDPTIQGTKILPASDSPYSVELLRETAPGKYEALTPKIDDGKLISFNLAKGDIYAIRLHNDSKFEAACTIRIDGVSRFALSDDPALREGLDLVHPGQSREIVGYYRDGKLVDSFQVGEYPDSVAAQILGKPSDDGMISITFAAAWQGGTPPQGEPVNESTVQGRPRPDPTTTVKRNIGAVRAVVRIRYVAEGENQE